MKMFIVQYLFIRVVIDGRKTYVGTKNYPSRIA